MKGLTPIFLHVPHASTNIPSEEWQYFITNNIAREIICMTDHYCDDLFRCEHEMISFEVNRLVCDVERFKDSKQEKMSEKGMGVVYSKCSDGTMLKNSTIEHDKYIIEKYYDSHHKLLESAVQTRLDKFDRCLIVDAHSFYETPLAYEDKQNSNRPDICLGSDEYHTSDKLIDYFTSEFQKRGYSVEINNPFSGSLVPNKFYCKDKRVQSIMIEINRGLYIDLFANRKEQYDKVKRNLYNILMSSRLNGIVRDKI